MGWDAGRLPAGAVAVCVVVTIVWGGVGEAVGSQPLVEVSPGPPWGEQMRERMKQEEVGLEAKKRRIM